MIDISNEIDDFVLGLYEIITFSTAQLELDFVIIGAIARDIVLEYGYNMTPRRATNGLDLGVRVNGWEQFHQLRAELLKSDQLEETKAIQKLVYRNIWPVDVVPYGGVSSEDKLIKWPPDQSIEMNVMGFEEAYNNSITVKIKENPLMEMQVASLANQAALKLFAWQNRSSPGDKDALDLALIINSYGPTISVDRIYSKEIQLLEEEDYELESVGARLLGRDIAGCIDPVSLACILDILKNETDEDSHSTLATAMSSTVSDTDYEKYLRYLKKIRSEILLQE